MQQDPRLRAILSDAFQALQRGDFAAARDRAAPVRAQPDGALLHALGTAGAGDVAGGARALGALARQNPGVRHPALDLADLLDRHGHPTLPHLAAAFALMPGDAALATRLGAAQAQAGAIGPAIAAFQAAADAMPADPAAWANLGKALAAAGRFAQAEQAFARLPPAADPQLRLNQAVALLKSGNLAAGWPAFRARHALPGRLPAPPGPELHALPHAAGRTVLLLHDEGFGDTLQFVRYAPLLARHAARVLLAVPPPLHRLLATLPGTEPAPSRPTYDTWCRIPDLPSVFGTTLETIPATLPYLAADPALVHAWAARLPPAAPGTRRIGLAWAGAGRPSDPAAALTDRQRSLPPAGLDALLAPLLTLPGTQWVSLQLGQTPPAGLIDPMPQVTDFADTAAIMAGLDGVISVDTAVLHLAAALGRPTLLLDRFDNCWRWLHATSASPWYPGVLTIVRQPAPGDWASVMATARAWAATL